MAMDPKLLRPKPSGSREPYLTTHDGVRLTAHDSSYLTAKYSANFDGITDYSKRILLTHDSKTIGA